MPRRIDEEALFDAVLHQWVAEGYDGATTKAIATRAGVNEATLFRRYGGKAALVVAALRARITSVPLGRVTATDDVVADITAVVSAYVETFRQVGAVFPLLLLDVARYPELTPALEAAQGNIAAVQRVIIHHQARGALRREPPYVAAIALLGPLFVTGLAVRAQGGSADVVIDIDAHVSGYLGGRSVP